MKNLFLIITLLLSTAVFAQRVSSDEALMLAEKFMTAKTSKPMSLVPFTFKTKVFDNMYFFSNAENTCFVVVAAEKTATPIIAYSFESGLDEQMPLPVQDYFNDVEAKILKDAAEKSSPDADILQEWTTLYNRGDLPVYLKVGVAPLLSTKWNQDCYYNDSVPTHPSGPCGHCYAGCVATAMGQVMKYHSYPSSGVGANTYGTGSYSNIHANFATATYEWNLMPNSINTYNEPIAKLLFHLGVSVNMGYAYDGSGAQSSNAAIAMRNNFSYADYLFYSEKDVMSEEIWLELIVNDLKSKRPIYYSGTSTEGGHAFVCHGIDNSNKLCINWGWGGAYDGYYTLSHMYGFNQNQAAIFGVEPPTGDIQYCQATSIHTALSDTITDGSGVNRYGNNSHCTWTIQPPDAGLIYINFTKVALDQDVDFVYVYNGTTANPGQKVAEITGYDLPPQILVWGPAAHIVFQSDEMLRSDGFEFYYTTHLVGIEEAWKNGKISVFPNPADDIMNIEIDPLILPAINRIELISLTGQTVKIIDNPSQSDMLDVSNLISGTYCLRFIGSKDSYFTLVEIQ